MNYSLISEYIEAIKVAEDNFEELSCLRLVLSDDGQPVMTSGNFAVGFKMKDEHSGKLYAVKCFTREQEGRTEAYREIAKELKDGHGIVFTIQEIESKTSKINTFMELHTLKKHIVYKDNDVSIYVNKSNSYIQVMIHDCHQRNDYNDTVLIPGDYVDAKTFHGYDILGDEVNTYIVLKKKNGDGKIVRLPDGVTIWSGFLFDDYVMTCCIGSVVNSKFKEDLFVRLHNKQNRIYSIYSLLDSKFSFGPYNYETIEYLWKSGVILDSKLVVNDSGSIWDISNYTRSANSSLVYFNKETDDYRIRIRDGLEHFRELEQSNNENILIAKTRRYEYRYDKKKDQLTTIDKDGFRGWTRRELAEATDIAYEGYSRLELGLED